MGVLRWLEPKPAGCRGRGWFLNRRECWRLLAAAECKDADEEDGEAGNTSSVPDSARSGQAGGRLEG